MSQFSSEARPLVDGLDLAAELLAFGGDVLQLVRIAGRETTLAPAPASIFGGELAEGAGGASHDRGLAADIEQGEGFLRNSSDMRLSIWLGALPRPACGERVGVRGQHGASAHSPLTRLATSARHPLPAARAREAPLLAAA